MEATIIHCARWTSHHIHNYTSLWWQEDKQCNYNYHLIVIQEIQMTFQTFYYHRVVQNSYFCLEMKIISWVHFSHAICCMTLYIIELNHLKTGFKWNGKIHMDKELEIVVKSSKSKNFPQFSGMIWKGLINSNTWQSQKYR